MTAPQALAAAFPGVRVLAELDELYATVDVGGLSISLHADPDEGWIAVTHRLTYTGMAPGRTPEEALAGLGSAAKGGA